MRDHCPATECNFDTGTVIVDRQEIEKVRVCRCDDGNFSVTLDRRFGGVFRTEYDAEQAAWLAAQALAIGAGRASVAYPALKEASIPERNIPENSEGE